MIPSLIKHKSRLSISLYCTLQFPYQKCHYSGCGIREGQCYLCGLFLFSCLRLQTNLLAPTWVEWRSWSCVHTDHVVLYSFVNNYMIKLHLFLPAKIFHTGSVASRCIPCFIKGLRTFSIKNQNAVIIISCVKWCQHYMGGSLLRCIQSVKHL